VEGLLIAQTLDPVSAPCARQSWRFPDAYTFVLPLLPKGRDTQALWFYNKPPNAQISVTNDFPAITHSHSGFQDLLASRAIGRLERIEQHKLDRVVSFHFAGEQGFVSVEPCVLIAELTGRNCNVILTDTAGIILGAAREITRDINRFRQVRAGLPYTPPPPYDKVDPRMASVDALQDVLAGRTLKKLRTFVDGFGPELTETVAVLAGVGLKTELTNETLTNVAQVIKDVASDPVDSMQRALDRPDLETLRRIEARQSTLDALTQALEKRLELLQKRLTDIAATQDAVQEANTLRGEADVLMAYQGMVKKGQTQADLFDFEGKPLVLELDPKFDAVGNAEKRYERARKREQRAHQALARRPEIERQLEETRGLLESLPNTTDQQLQTLYDEHVKKPKQQYRSGPGMRFSSPQDFTVFVGKNAKDNDTLTFRVARSRDMWLHVQGYHGSHVIIQAENQDIPFETILYAASLAAGYSKAKDSDNVAVDYTLKKHVWKVKGAPAGAVNFTQHKTVYVTPQRH